VAVFVVALVLSTFVVVLVIRTTGRGQAYPAAWSSRVAPLVTIVEGARELRFEHPVVVDFLDDQQFRTHADEADAASWGPDRARIEEEIGLLRTLGAVSGDLDLVNDADQLRGSGALASYSYADEHIRVRGDDVTPAVESELVVALVLALQDQRFHVGARLRDAKDDAGRETALQALALGDATRVEEDWVASLTAAEQAAIEDDRVRLEVEAGDGASRLPGVVKAMAGIPQEFGEAMVEAALAGGGQRAVDGLFLVPPTTEEHLLDPWALVQDHQGYLSLPAPVVGDDSTHTSTGTFGAISWLLLLAERLPSARALDAAQGWGGDTFVTYDRDGTSCVKLVYAADGSRDLAEMESALAAWARRAPGKESIAVRRSGQHLLLRSCTPSSDVPASPSEGPRQAVDLAVGRSRLSVVLLGKDMDVATARCGAALLLPGPDALTEPAPSANRAAVRQVQRACSDPRTTS
jgi:hypothetical protein